MLHPQSDLTLLPIIGHIIIVSWVLSCRHTSHTSHSHCFANPLAVMLLGPCVSLPPNAPLKRALLQSKCEVFSSELQDELTSTLAQFGCRVLPTPSNLMTAIQQVARYEFLTKPAAAIALINTGIPNAFWSAKSPDDIKTMYISDCQFLQLRKILSSLFLSFYRDRNLECVDISTCLNWALCSQMNWVSSYDLLLGSCVCIAKEIKIVFNGVSGLARTPIAHTCSLHFGIANFLLKLH